MTHVLFQQSRVDKICNTQTPTADASGFAAAMILATVFVAVSSTLQSILFEQKSVRTDANQKLKKLKHTFLTSLHAAIASSRVFVKGM